MSLIRDQSSGNQRLLLNSLDLNTGIMSMKVQKSVGCCVVYKRNTQVFLNQNELNVPALYVWCHKETKKTCCLDFSFVMLAKIPIQILMSSME